MDPFDTVTDADICMAISNANGHQPSLFVPEECFHQLVKKQATLLTPPLKKKSFKKKKVVFLCFKFDLMRRPFFFCLVQVYVWVL